MNSKKIYIILFVILYAFIAIVSGIHGFSFFGLANVPILAGMLAIAFEVGQAAVLFSILTNPGQRKKFMPWLLMVILTLVQVMGNVYNCYRHLILNAGDNLRFFKEPIFIWTDLPDAEANVIISYLTGAILPICGLLLTAMITSFLGKEDEEKEEIEYVEEDEEPIEEEVEDIEEDEPSEEALKKFKEIEKETPKEEQEEIPLNDMEEKQDEYIENIPENNEEIPSFEDIEAESILKPTDESENKKQEIYKEKVKDVPEVKLDTKNEVLNEDPPLENKEKSHFINI